MNKETTFTFLEGIFALMTFSFVMRSQLEPYRNNPGLWNIWTVVLMSLLLFATNVRVIPGGPFVSIHADIFPAAACLLMLITSARAVLTASIPRRIGLFFAMIVSIAVIALVVLDVAVFWRNRFARGALFGW